MTRAGKFRGWAPELLLGVPVYGQTLGIVGAGRIGRAVARRARFRHAHPVPQPLTSSS